MNLLKRESPINGDRWVSLHDARLTQIVYCENAVVFCFEEGFSLIENGQCYKANKGIVELSECNFSDFSCMLFKRRTTKKGAKLYGKPISLEELNKKLVSEKKYMELFIELYDFNHSYWRGELLPHKCIFKRLAPLITIEAMDFFPMTYSWE